MDDVKLELSACAGTIDIKNCSFLKNDNPLCIAMRVVEDSPGLMSRKLNSLRKQVEVLDFFLTFHKNYI